MGAPEVDENGQFPASWSPRRRQTASDARNGKRDAPIYIELAAKMLDSYNRKEASRPPPSPTLNADVRVYIDAPTYNYRTIVIKDE